MSKQEGAPIFFPEKNPPYGKLKRTMNSIDDKNISRYIYRYNQYGVHKLYSILSI